MPVSTWEWGAIADTKRVAPLRLAPRQGYQRCFEGLLLAQFGDDRPSPPSRERPARFEIAKIELEGGRVHAMGPGETVS